MNPTTRDIITPHPPTTLSTPAAAGRGPVSVAARRAGRAVLVEALEGRRLLSGTGGDAGDGSGDGEPGGGGTAVVPWADAARLAGLDRLDEIIWGAGDGNSGDGGEADPGGESDGGATTSGNDGESDEGGTDEGGGGTDAGPRPGTGTAIALIDSGVDYTHPALGGGIGAGFRVVGGYDFVDDDDDPMDTLGHGTAVAGLLVGDGFEAGGERMRGVATGADLLALRVDDDGSVVPAARLEAALRWVIDHREAHNIVAVNMSLGSGHFAEPTETSDYADELTELSALGVTVVAATGNGGNEVGFGIDFPAAHPDVVAVGATDAFGNVADFTERSADMDYLAPGVDVPSLGLGGTFVTVEGTSFATPFVTAAVAVARSIDPAFTDADVRSLLRSTAVRNFDGDTEFINPTNLVFPQVDVGAVAEAARLRAADPDVVPGRFGYSNDLAVDAEGVTHLVWFDADLATLRHATRSAGGVWGTAVTIDDTQVDMGHYAAVAVDDLGRPHVAYFDAYHGDLKYATWARGAWQAETVDARGSTGLYPDIVVRDGHLPAIGFYRKIDGDLVVASKNEFDSWDYDLVDADGDVGRGAAVATDSAGGLHLAYSNTTTGLLRYAAEVSPGTFATGNVDEDVDGVGFIDLAIDADDRPRISYYDAYPGDLRYAELREPPEGEDATWTTRVLASRGATGLYTQLEIDRATGVTSLLYYDRRSDVLNRAVIDGDDVRTTSLVENGGRYISLTFANGNGYFTHGRSGETSLGFGSFALEPLEEGTA